MEKLMADHRENLINSAEERRQDKEKMLRDLGLPEEEIKIKMDRFDYYNSLYSSLHK